MSLISLISEALEIHKKLELEKQFFRSSPNITFEQVFEDEFAQLKQIESDIIKEIKE